MLDQKLKDLKAKRQASQSMEQKPIDVNVPYSYALPKSEIPVPEQTVQDIKTVFTPDPPPSVIGQSSSTQESSQTVPNTDTESYERRIASMRKDVNNQDLLLGLVPLATSVLAGGQLGEGVDVAGKYYTDITKDAKDRNRSLENKLLEIEKSRAVAKAKRSESSKLPTASNLVPVVEDGVTRYKWVADAAGAQVANKPKSGLSFEDRLELQKKSQQFRQEQKDKDQNIAAGARFQQKLESDKDFLDYKNQARNSQRALELLSLGKGVADAGTRTVIAKGLFGDVGNIAVQEAAAISGAPDLITRYETFKDMFNKGTRFGDTDRADLIEMASMIRERAPKIIEKIAMKKAEAENKISGADVSDVAKSLSKDVTTGKVMVKVIYNGRVKQIPIEKYPEAVKQYKAKLFTGKE